jgi:predicted nucleic acid-binding protein
MIHLDANLLIAATDPTDPHVEAFRRILATGDSLSTDAVAWTEVRSRPVDSVKLKVLRQVLRGGILPFDQKCADLAGEMFILTQAKRRHRLDTMIAATAILAGAELATVNPADFAPFLPHGLKLFSFASP